jgi:hypothetical protein
MAKFSGALFVVSLLMPAAAFACGNAMLPVVSASEIGDLFFESEIVFCGFLIPFLLGINSLRIASRRKRGTKDRSTLWRSGGIALSIASIIVLIMGADKLLALHTLWSSHVGPVLATMLIYFTAGAAILGPVLLWIAHRTLSLEQRSNNYWRAASLSGLFGALLWVSCVAYDYRAYSAAVTGSTIQNFLNTQLTTGTYGDEL